MKRPPQKTENSKPARDHKSQAGFFVGNNRTPIKVRFGTAIKARREFLHLTQEQVAIAANVNRTYLSEIENGRENISLERAERLAYALQSKLSDLLSEK